MWVGGEAPSLGPMQRTLYKIHINVLTKHILYRTSEITSERINNWIHLTILYKIHINVLTKHILYSTSERTNTWIHTDISHKTYSLQHFRMISSGSGAKPPPLDQCREPCIKYILMFSQNIFFTELSERTNNWIHLTILYKYILMFSQNIFCTELPK